MQFAVWIILLVGLQNARADFCSVCDSIRNVHGAQTIPLVYTEQERDDGETEADVSASLRPRRPALMRIQMDRLPPLQPDRMTRPAPALSAAQRAAELANEYRRRSGLAELRLDPALTLAADRYAREMARYGHFDHTGVRGDNVGDRVRAAGGWWRSVGENIASGQRSPNEVMGDWYRSPGHRQNLLSSNFRRHGLAEYNGYWVHVFAD